MEREEKEELEEVEAEEVEKGADCPAAASNRRARFSHVHPLYAARLRSREKIDEEAHQSMGRLC